MHPLLAVTERRPLLSVGVPMSESSREERISELVSTLKKTVFSLAFELEELWEDL